jgi:hypothetical protein
MKKKSASLFDFQKRYRTETDCLNAVMKLRWPEGFRCTKCNYRGGYRLSKRRAIECASCRHQISITAGTVFHKTRIPLLTWFWMIFLVAQDKGGVSALRLTKLLGMHYSTVWHILHKIRIAMSQRDNKVIRLSGLIELDEGFFGRKKPKSQVLVLIESNNDLSGKLVMKRILSTMASQPEIKRVVEESIAVRLRCKFVTDGATGHNVLAKMGHQFEAHASTPASAAEDLPWVHRAISLAKRFLLGTYHGIKRKHLQNYLDEFCYRYNRRFKESHLYENLINACVMAVPIAYPALTR